ncbi:density-regulated DRP1 [Pyrrhoderma noxium]|uniref:Translation machinery-associated protein 22 n=1 Tax=Pyrrhoderma noxium TaxID=2282107 RepID=A0A286UGJ5_9AGAM|nr:density-regulated DRP1 [Pyrrhoderma noxium]
MSTSEVAGEQIETIKPVQVLYCAVCSYPPEYCEFGQHLTKCKEWLQKAHPNLFNKYYSEEALQAKIGTLSLEAQQKLEQDMEKAEKKAEKKESEAKKKQQESQVFIKRIERNKRKYVTSIYGLEVFDIDLKKAAKFFGKRFATGSSVTKNPQGKDEIVIQGDVSDDIMDLISDKVDFLSVIPEDNVELVEEKKK